MTGQPIRLDPVGIAGMAGVAAGVVLLVTALTLPALRRMMKPEELRTE